jgi:riboflavin transporter FmnP
MAFMAVFTALGALLSFIPIPIIPGSTLTYDLANVPALLGALVYGPVAGCVIGILSWVIHSFSGDFIGGAMNIVLVIAFVVPVSLICRNSKTLPRLIIGLVVGSLTVVLLSIPTNIVAWWLYSGTSPEEVLAIVVPVILPFNLIKTVLNSIFSVVLYKSLHKLLER